MKIEYKLNSLIKSKLTTGRLYKDGYYIPIAEEEVRAALGYEKKYSRNLYSQLKKILIKLQNINNSYSTSTDICHYIISSRKFEFILTKEGRITRNYMRNWKYHFGAMHFAKMKNT